MAFGVAHTCFCLNTYFGIIALVVRIDSSATPPPLVPITVVINDRSRPRDAAYRWTYPQFSRERALTGRWGWGGIDPAAHGCLQVRSLQRGALVYPCGLLVIPLLHME